MDLKGKNVVVTGGGQGLGLAMALEFAKAGANLSLIDINGSVPRSHIYINIYNKSTI